MKKLLVLLATLMFSVLSFGDKYEDYANPTALVSPEKAKEIIETVDNVVIFDIRKELAFATGHIPGAQDIWRPEISADEGEYDFGGMRASKEKMEEILSGYGVDEDTYILLYDAKSDYDAARMWWILEMYGHEKMSLIDGGIQGWKNAGLKVEMGKAKTPTKTEYKFTNETNTTKLATLEDVKAIVNGDEGVIIDTRTDKEHTGGTTKSGAFRAGRIPSETFIKWETAVNYEEDKLFKTTNELKAIYGEFEGKDIIPYCQSGVRSAHTTFVLTQLLGYDTVKNYDGSWIEWSYNKELPIETK